MNADFTYAITDLSVMGDPKKDIAMIRAELVDHLPNGPRRNGKYIHLTMTTNQAMRLLAMLKEAQRTLGLPDTHQATMTHVPPAKDRN